MGYDSVVDVWLNTPLPPNEASGTSGMKASLNGIPSLSTLDGWWPEAVNDGVNGWAIGDPDSLDDQKDADSLYDVLAHKVTPTFYDDRARWLATMREAIKLAFDLRPTAW